MNYKYSVAMFTAKRRYHSTEGSIWVLGEIQLGGTLFCELVGGNYNST